MFPNPSDDFKKKLLKGGGVIINHNVNNLDEKSRDSNDERAQLLNKPKLGGSDHTKKHKRPDDNTFSHLFGPPIPKVTAKVSPDSKSKSSSSNSKIHQTLPNVQKPGSDKKSQHDKKTVVKDKVKQKHSSPHKEGRKSDEKQIREEKKLSHSKERDQSREKTKKISSPKHSPSNLKSSTQKTEMKHPTMNTSAKKSKKEKKEKNHDKEKERDKKDDKSSAHKQKILSTKEIFKEKQKPNEKILAVQNDLPFDSSNKVVPVESIKKTEKHKHKKKDKNKKDESKEKDKKRDRSERSSSKSSAIYDEATDPRSNKPKETKIQQTPLDALMGEISERESSDSETENHNQKQEKIVDTPNNYQAVQDVISKSVSHTTSKSEKSAKRSSKDKARSIEKEEKKRKRKNKDEIDTNDKTSSSMDPPKKIYKKEESYKHQDLNSSTSLDNIKVSPITDIIEKDLSIDYMSDLKDLQHKIMTLQSNTELQQVVEIIAATGRFEVTSKTFDFDLCALDKDTVQKLQTFFQPS